MRARPDVGAIVHTHSLYATMLGCCRKDIPAVHYMIAASGGPNIRCSAYATYGTAELSTVALAALEDRTCCILANHGMIATGPDLAKAQWLAVELETIAKQYYLTLCIGGPVVLPRRRDRPRQGAVQELRAAAQGRRRQRERGRAPSARRRRAEAAPWSRSTSSWSAAASTAPALRATPPGAGSACCCASRTTSPKGTSSRSGKLVHGGLRYLEYYEFRLVREALIEREVLLRAAPHIVWPMRFVLPHVPDMRPAWLVRLGLFLYDHLGGRKLLPATRALDLHRAPGGPAAQARVPQGVRVFRLLGRRCAAGRAQRARRPDQGCGDPDPHRTGRAPGATAGLWQVELEDRRDGSRRRVTARGLVNAAGPWVEQVLSRAVGVNSSRRVRLVKGSHLVTRKFWDGNQAYLLQNTDKRVIFVNPYEGDLALIGTTDIPVEGQPEDAAIEPAETALPAGRARPLLRRPARTGRHRPQLQRRPAAL